MTTRRGKQVRKPFLPFLTIKSDQKEFLDLVDNSRHEINPESFFGLENIDPRLKNGIVARFLNQFISLNSSVLNQFDLKVSLSYDGSKVRMVIVTGARVGASPLKSPRTGKYELGLIIKPRFGWNGIGPTMAIVGWKNVPEILDQPIMKVSEKNIPPWVLSSLVLKRIDALIKKIDRKFSFQEQILPSPKGTVNWASYSANSMSKAKFFDFECRYPSLVSNQQLRGIIHFALLKQIQSLRSQYGQGLHVRALIAICTELIAKVSDAPPVKVQNYLLEKLFATSFNSEDFKKGIQAIDWTVNNRGLAGLGDVGGVPWLMSMEVLFENYVESVFENLAKLKGGVLKSGRRRETIISINWERRSEGSQGYLLPDLTYKRDEESLYIIDAKYKSHWEEIVVRNWHALEDEVREAHRNDLFQILAYSSVYNVSKISSCLVYPCRRKIFEELKSRNRAISKATIVFEDKVIYIRLIAIPLDLQISEGVELFEAIL